MKYQKFLALDQKYPWLRRLLDVPTYPEADRYLPFGEVAEFRERATRDYIEDWIEFVALSDVSTGDLANLHYKKFDTTPVFRCEDRRDEPHWKERHALLYFHLEGEDACFRAFLPPDNNLYTYQELVDMAKQLLHPHTVVVDAVVTHVFKHYTGEPKYGRKCRRELNVHLITDDYRDQGGLNDTTA